MLSFVPFLSFLTKTVGSFVVQPVCDKERDMEIFLIMYEGGVNACVCMSVPSDENQFPFPLNKYYTRLERSP